MNQESSSRAELPALRSCNSFSITLVPTTAQSFVLLLCRAFVQDQGLVENLLKSVWIVQSSKSSASQIQDLPMNSCEALKKQMTRLWHDSSD